ncbi:B12-binding domain-containing radical SAM protein [Candidatus Poribacteria bacterium]|nr:MAG: B12-binding domain-containing radical SAM protein [Candidatus Poribacteria bacterium]
MRVLLIQPGSEDGRGFRHSLGLVEPLGLEMIGGALKGRHEVELIDLRLSPFEELIEKLEDFKPHACGISSTFTVDYNPTMRIAEVIKEVNGDIFVFVGGHHPSLCPEDFDKPFIDAIVIGEGERTAAELMECLEERGDLRKVKNLVLNAPEGQIHTPRGRLIRDLDSLPYPDRGLIGRYWRKYRITARQPLSSVETARGCPYRCRFCSVWVFYGGIVRFKSPERVVNEIERTEAENVFFTDDNFFTNVERAKEIARLIRERGIRRKYIIQTRSDVIASHPELISDWAEIGLEGVFIGFEKARQEELDSIAKRNTVENNERALKILRANGIEPLVSFIVDPDYDREDFATLRRYIRKLRLRFPSFSVLTPLPGTELFEQLKEKIVCRNYDLFDLVHPVLPTKLPLKEFCREFARLYRMAYPPIYLYLLKAGIFLKSLFGKVSYSDWKQVFRDWARLADPRAYLEDILSVCEAEKWREA